MNEQFNLNEIVKIEQMPIVFEQLEKIGAYIGEQLKGVDELECNEENKQIVKNKRTEINNTLTVLEEKRKEIKKQLLTPYEIFNEKYENECKNQLENAKNVLTNKINLIENEQKSQKEEELREFFEQYQEEFNLKDIISFEDTGVNVTLSASIKSLKEQILDFCKKVNNDIETILLEEDRNELLLEYKNNGFDYTKAKMLLLTRKKQLEELKKQSELKEEQQKQNEIVEERIDELVAPMPIFEQEEELEVTFTVKATKDKILKLKQFLKEEEIVYE